MAILKGKWDGSYFTLQKPIKDSSGIAVSSASKTETLTNKTLTSPTLTTPSITTPTVTGTCTVTMTAAAAAAGSIRGVVGNCDPAAAGLASGTLCGVRGACTLNANGASSGSFAYGTQGKLINKLGAITGGSGHFCGVMAQVDLGGGSVVSGHVACLIASGQSLPASAYVDMIYAESGGNAINSVLKSNVKSTYVFDITPFESATNCHKTTAVAGDQNGWLKCYVDGAVRYIPLYTASA